MSKNQGLPDRWPTDVSEESKQKEAIGLNTGSENLARTQQEDTTEPNTQASTSASAGKNYQSESSGDLVVKNNDAKEPESSGNLVANNNGKLAEKKTRQQRKKPSRSPWYIRMLTRWELWAITTLTVSGGLGVWSVTTLLQVPPEPDCEENFWALVSARERLYCAQQEANQETVEGLLDAIAHASKLSKNHPMRSETDAQIEKWSVQLLDLAEQLFEEGKLTEAVAAASQIPSSTEASKAAKKKIERWESIWSQGEKVLEKIGRAHV